MALEQRHNLPAHPLPLIGRDREIAAVREHLLAAERGLLTLTGAGGCGKTRLALAVAAGLLGELPDGVWLVELAPLADPSLVVQAVASALEVREGPGRPLRETLTGFLQPRALLLVLDNCEHLITACAQLVDDLLAACPSLRLLATSREPLQIPGEVTWRVPSLEAPDPSRPLSLEQLVRYPAVQLFVARAKAVQPGFTPTARNAAAMAQVCRRLDGIPLAIELAATRVRVLPVEKIAARLDDSFQLLSGGSRTAPGRQQTLAATLDWSHALLGEGEQALFRRLAVFAGGWELEAAEAVGAGGAVAEADVLELLTRLVDKSLVLAEEHGGEERLRLLEPIRQYGWAHLERSGEVEAVRRRHADYFLALAERAATELHGARVIGPFGSPHQLGWLGRLGREQDNLRLALGWLERAGEAERLLRLGGALWFFWLLGGDLGEGYRWLVAGLARADGVADATRARALYAAGTLAWCLGDYAHAVGPLVESVALFRALGDRANTALALNHLAMALGFQDDYAGGRRVFEESVALCQAIDHGWGVGLAQINFVKVEKLLGHSDEAWRLAEESLPRFRAANDTWQTAEALVELGSIAQERGDAERVAAFAAESLGLTRTLGTRWYLPETLELAAGAASERGQPARATRLLGATEALREATGQVQQAGSRPAYARAVAVLRGALDEATFAAAWAEGRALGAEQAIAEALDTGREPRVAAPQPSAMAASPLTEREQEVAVLVARGLTNRQIAAALVISERTADNHVSHILGKLDLHTRAQIAAWVAQAGLLERRGD